MRRISVEYATLGTILGRAVYDSSGALLLDAGTVLDAVHVPVLSRLGVREIIIQDPRVDDIIIVPSISEEVEAQAIRLLHRLVDSNRGKLIKHINLDLTEVDRLVKVMIQSIDSAFMGEINTEGCLSLGNYDYIHPVKVAGLCLFIGKKAGYNRAELVSLGMAALLQDIGYIQVPQHVLMNLQAADENKSPEYKAHPEAGYSILSESGVDDGIAKVVLQHHERWDGSGYPAGLKGSQISPLSRIISIASSYYGLVSRRPGQEPFPPPDAAEYIAAYSGELFDPELAQTFVRSIPFYPKGILVKLSTGESGIVTEPNIGYIGRPQVRVCYDRSGEELSELYDIDLKEPEYQSRLVTDILEY